jgi:hypothetical protein
MMTTSAYNNRQFIDVQVFSSSSPHIFLPLAPCRIQNCTRGLGAENIGDEDNDYVYDYEDVYGQEHESNYEYELEFGGAET